MIKILYNTIFGYINVNCCGCNKLLNINSYDYNKYSLYSCSIGCGLAFRKK
jgi:hypothetical protein